jgi:preprotein translocase subunit SecD
MLKSLRGRVITILAVVAVALGYLYTNGIKLGLDLQGGIHLVLEVDDPDGTLTAEARADAIDRAERIIRTRIDELGVEEPLVQKVGSERIIVELAGIQDEERAKEIVQQTAYLEWRLVLPTTTMDAALARVDRAIVATLGADSIRALGRDTEAPSTDIEELLFSGDTASADSAAAAADTAVVAQEEAEPQEVELRPFTGLLNQGNQPGTYLVAEQDVAIAVQFLAMPEVRRAMPRDVELSWGWEPVGLGALAYRELYVLEDEAFLTGDMLETAVAQRDPQFNQAQVQFELSRRGGRIFSQITGQHVGDQIAILLDGEVVSAPVVRDRIGARGQIDLGQADMEEARDLALVLRAGALPARLQVMEERAVGPSLGQDSIDQGRIAGIVGIILVILVMTVYYRMAGFLSVIALGVYVVLVMGGLAALNATLTLPGIAGLILSIGMAVDANIIIFERLKEEIRTGKTMRSAVEAAFKRAWAAILDSNVCSIGTGFVLFHFGTGPIKGFAVALIIGVAVSLFTAVTVTRLFVNIVMSTSLARNVRLFGVSPQEVGEA